MRYLKHMMENLFCIIVQMLIFNFFLLMFQSSSLQVVAIAVFLTAYISYSLLSFIFRVNKKESE